MKQIFLSIAILFSLNSFAQTDSLLQTYADKTITVKIPLKGVVLYANYAAEKMTWDNRNAPDGFKPLIGSGTKPDTLINVTITAGQLAEYIIRLTGERYGVIHEVVNSLFHNSPVIVGYTDLFTQVVTKANGNGTEKNAAQYVVWRYGKYSDTMDDLILQYWNKGLNWIQH